MRSILRSTFYTLLFLLLASPALAQTSRWQAVHTPVFESTLSDVFFIDGEQGWAVGDEGAAYFTRDTGFTWEAAAPAETEASLDRVDFVSPDAGWIGADDGTVYRTTDAGATWQSADLNASLPVEVDRIRDMDFVNTDIGYVVAGIFRQSYVLKTTDGGATWVLQDSLVDGSNNWTAIAFYDADRGVIVGDDAAVQRYTTDGGETWVEVTIDDQMFRNLTEVSWIDESTVVAVGQGLEFSQIPTSLYRSTDGGASWTTATQHGPYLYDRAQDVYFKDAQRGIAVGTNGFSRQFITTTDDGGQTWTSDAAPYAFGLQRIAGSGDTLVVLGSTSHFMRSFDFGASWELVPLDAPSSIVGIDFAGDSGRFITRNGLVYQTAYETGTEPGVDWAYVGETGVWEAGSIAFADALTGFALKANRHILRTTDGGATWETVVEPVEPSFRNRVGGIAAPSAQVAYAWFTVGGFDAYRVLKTEDGGATWNEVYAETADVSLGGDVAFFDEQTGVLLSEDLWATRTADGGATWATDVAFVDFPEGFVGSKDVEDVQVTGATTAWAVGDEFIAHTEDAGATWRWVEHGIADIDSSFYAVAFVDDEVGYVGAFDGTILYTEDGGQTWSLDTELQGRHLLFSAGASADGSVYFGTSDGFVYGTTSTAVAIEDDGHTMPKAVALEQNYPNPFHPSTTIRFTLVDAGPVELTVFDVTGRVVATLAKGPMAAGSHEVTFDAHALPSGVYVYQLDAGSSTQRRAMVLVR